MKKLLAKFVSLFLVMFLIIQGASTVAMAQSPNYDERAVSAQGASIQETKIDPRTTEYLINSNKGTVTILFVPLSQIQNKFINTQHHTKQYIWAEI